MLFISADSDLSVTAIQYIHHLSVLTLPLIGSGPVPPLPYPSSQIWPGARLWSIQRSQELCCFLLEGKHLQIKIQSRLNTGYKDPL